jgi:hypothetical protein
VATVVLLPGVDGGTAHLVGRCQVGHLQALGQVVKQVQRGRFKAGRSQVRRLGQGVAVQDATLLGSDPYCFLKSAKFDIVMH